MRFAALLLIMLFVFFRGQAAVRFVRTTPAGTGSGNSWANASGDLQAMINSSAAGDSVFAGAGTYMPSAAGSFSLKQGVKIFGGFAASGNPLFSQRNWLVNITRLSGHATARLLGNISGLNTGTILNGFHLTGAANIAQGGIAYISSSSLQFIDCNFHDNFSDYQGGVFYMAGSSPVFNNCRFTNNTGTAQGTVIYSNNSMPEFTDCRFTGTVNSVAPGSCLYILMGQPKINRCLFDANGSNGGIIFNFDGIPFFRETVFSNNSSQGCSVLQNFVSSNPFSVINCIFYGNNAANTGLGGLVLNNAGQIDFINCTIFNNTVAGNINSGLFANISSGGSSFTNCIVWGNNAPLLSVTQSGGTNPVYTYSIIQGVSIPANNVFNTVPLFLNAVNPAGADGNWGTSDDGLAVQWTSVAVNSGNNTALPASVTTDIGGAQRVQNGTVEMGAYEMTAPTCVSSSSISNVSVCAQALPYTWNGNSYSSSGTYLVHLTNAGGCDSAATLQLTVVPQLSVNVQQSVCASALPYVWNGQSYTAAGNYSVQLISAVGCDSIVNLQLSVKQSSSSSTNLSICSAALPYTWNGQSFPASGSHTVHLTNAAGCDSSAVLNLAVRQSTFSTTIVQRCPAQLPYTWNGNSYGTYGSYAISLLNTQHCDSIATLRLENLNGAHTLAPYINLHPVPVQNQLEINVYFPCGHPRRISSATLTLYTILGQKMKTIQMPDDRLQIDVSSLMQGAYIVVYEGHGYFVARKFLR